MYSTDKIAILLATYNGEKYISAQIDSILEQTNQEWMLYIHDDGSTDGTIGILKEYADKYAEQIHIVDGPPTGGAKQNFFYLFHQVEAPYYMCCDQDDVWLPEKIEKTVNEIKNLEKKNENLPCLVFTDLKIVDEKLEIIHEKMSQYQGLDHKNVTLNRALIQNVVTGCTMMVNRTMREELIRVSDYTNVLMHDWWALLVATRYGKVSYVEDSTILYRQHGNNGVGAQNSNSLFYMIRRMFQGKEIKQSLLNTRKQAGLFCELYGVEENILINIYAHIGEKNKFERLSFYLSNNIKKSTLSKNIGLFIWG